ncbi:uncharacterized protein LOC143909939 [Arctopsyche grandis]|uniref:uncharacterized protein LOC143909939 n=1 Tax=Arctopsyche grandis TaxID=121162 RepID=UPI00406D81A3
MRSTVLVCAVIFITIIYSGDAKKKPKPVLNYNSGVKVCDDANSRAMMETSDLRAVRVNETLAKLEGKFELKKTMQDWKLVILLEKKTPLGSREVVMTHEVPNLCTEIQNKDGDSIYSVYLRAINFPAECPIKPDTYEITNMIANTNDLSLTSMMEGEYTLTFTFYEINLNKDDKFFSSNKDTKLGCLSFTCLVEPGE